MGKGVFKIINYNLKEITQKIRSVFDEILNIVYPPLDRCINCNQPGYEGLCPICKASIKKLNLKEQNKISYGIYGGILKKLILDFKYKKNFTAGYLLADLLMELIEENYIKADVICYIPMSKKSIKKRGFNQCKVIANNISKKIDIPVKNYLIKCKDNGEQKKLSKDERIINVKGVFKVKKNCDLLNKNIILLDDVITTGATVDECEKILKKSGANKITILTIAKSNI